jgi:hypothetical protein
MLRLLYCRIALILKVGALSLCVCLPALPWQGQMEKDWEAQRWQQLINQVGARDAAEAYGASIKRSQQLVVMIEGNLGDAPTIGAGIAFGLDKDGLYILTANHVVRRGTVEANSLRVKLKSSPTLLLQAELLSHFDVEADLAAIRVVGWAGQKADVCGLEFGQLEELWQRLKRGFTVHAVGNPNGIGWAMSVSPELVAEVTDSHVMFQSTFIGRGDSGGALIGDRGNLLAMIQADQPPFASAMLLSKALQIVGRWDYPVDLMDSPFGKFGYEGYGTRLTAAAGTGDLRTVQRMLDACWNPSVEGRLAIDPLGESGAKGQVEVVKAIIAAGVSADAMNYALSRAAGADQIGTMEILLSHGAKANAPRESGSTPLHSAADGGHANAIKVLLAHGANVNAKRSDGVTPLYLAASSKCLEAVTVLLAAGGGVGNRGQEGRTPLHRAVSSGDAAIVKALLEAGAEVNAKDVWGKTPLATSSEGAVDILKLLHAHGAKR